MTVPLPETGDGSRRRRRLEQQKRGRWRRLVVRVLALVVLVGVIAAGVWLVVGDDDDGDPIATASSSTTVDAPEPGAEPLGEDVPVDLVVLTDDHGTVYGVTILAPATATIVHVPPGTLVEVPSLGLVSLVDAAREGGGTVLQQSLENVLGLAFGSVVQLDPAGLAGELERTGPVTAGDVTVDASNVVDFLSAVDEGGSLQRLVRHQAFWAAMVADGDSTLDGVHAMAGRDVRQRVLPVETVSGVGADELFRIVDDDLAALVALAFPGVASAEGDDARIRVRILNGAGTPGLAQRVQPLLVGAGAEVTLSGNADRFDYATTQVVYYDDASVEDARAVQAALGVGELVKSLTELAVVDVTVVVGADFLAAHPDAGG